MSSDNVYKITEVWGYCVALVCVHLLYKINISSHTHIFEIFTFENAITKFLRIYWMEEMNMNISEKVF